MPWLAVEKTYQFEGPEGTVSLLDLFDGRRQLIVYRAFLDPGVHGWPDHGCVGCSLMADHIGNLAHLHARDTTLVYASRGSQADISRIKQRMGWSHPWYTIVPTADAAFDVDFGVDEWHGTNAFIREGDQVYRTYFIDSRGDEVFDNTFHFLDMPASEASRVPDLRAVNVRPVVMWRIYLASAEQLGSASARLAEMLLASAGAAPA